MSDNKTEKINEREELIITETVRRRLPAYYRALITMYGEGREKVSSRQLSAVIGLTESQIRTDLLSIGCKGQKAYGYNIARLYTRIGEIMRLRDRYTAVIVGEGALAEAVSDSHLFTKRGIKLLRRFCTADMSELEGFCQEHTVDIMILSCSGTVAWKCLAMAESVGVLGVMNLSETDLCSEKLTVRNLHIEDALMMLCSEL